MSCLRRARRTSASSVTVRPRYSETTSVELSASSARSSSTVSRLASVGILCLLVQRAAGARRWVPGRGDQNAPATVRSAGAQPPGGGKAPVCLGVPTLVPGAGKRRSGPVDQAPSESPLAPGFEAHAVSGGPSIFSSDDAARARHRVDSAAAQAAAARTAGTSTRIPGPIVLAIVSPLRYCPFAPDGLARFTASSSVVRFS